MTRLATCLLPVLVTVAWNVIATQQASTGVPGLTSSSPTVPGPRDSNPGPTHNSLELGAPTQATPGVSASTRGCQNGENLVLDPTRESYDRLAGEATSFDNEIFSESDKPMEVPGYKKSLDLLTLVTVPIFTVLGIVGNCLTLVIMNRGSFKSLTTSRILVALALSDLTVLVMTPFMKPFFIKLIGVNILSQSIYSCKIFIWVLRMAKLSSSWWVLFIAGERFLAIWLPLKVKAIVTKKTLSMSLAFVAVFIGLFLGLWAGYCSVLVNGKCVPNLPIDTKYTRHAQVFALLGSVIHSYIPIGGTAILNTLTVVRLFKLSEARKALTKNSSDDVTTRTSAMLFGVSFTFLVLVSPNCLSQITLAYNGISFQQSQEPNIVVLRAAVNTLEHLNFTINFFLYVLCSKVFRGELVKILCCRGRYGKLDSSSDNINTRLTSVVSSARRRLSVRSQDSEGHSNVVTDQDSVPTGGKTDVVV